MLSGHHIKRASLIGIASTGSLAVRDVSEELGKTTYFAKRAEWCSDDFLFDKLPTIRQSLGASYVEITTSGDKARVEVTW